MHKYGLAFIGVAMVASFGLGSLVSSHSNEPKAVAATPAPTGSSHDLALECRSALRIGSEALGAAVSGIGQAQSAVATSPPHVTASQASPVANLLGSTSAKVQGLLQQYNAAQAACQSAVAVPSSTPTQNNVDTASH